MNEILDIINNTKELTFDQEFDIYKKCSLLLASDAVSDGQQLLIHILNNKFKFTCDDIISDLIDAAGFYPYLKKENLSSTSLSTDFSLGCHKSDELDGVFFHQDQKKVLDFLYSDKNVIVSAPTSFGKSLLIQEIVARKAYKNIIIIQPTLALLDETRRNLLKYSDDYKIIVRTTQEPSSNLGNIFLLTAERVNEYTFFENIDFLIIDEFYKISNKRNDDRLDALNNAFYKIYNRFKCRFYLLGPNIDGISEGFKEKYNAVFYKTNTTLVDCEAINIFKQHVGEFAETGPKQLAKREALYRLLFELREEQNIIYCQSPKRARELAKEFNSYCLKNGLDKKIVLDIYDWIDKYVDEKWGVKRLLSNGISYHDGALQRHITTSVVNYFNEGLINFLFCTTTIIEGVNTSVKNIIYFDKKKGRSTKIDFFDYSNIKGRAGRFMQHYVGRIYNFNPPPAKDNVIVDFPFFDQSPVSDEILININDEDVQDRTTQQYEFLKSIPSQEHELFKSNGINIKGQQLLLQLYMSMIKEDPAIITWTGAPNYSQLQFCIKIAQECLEGIDNNYYKRLTRITFDYGCEHQSLYALIQSQYRYELEQGNDKNLSDEEIFDNSILETFKIVRTYFQYKIPKWLNVLHTLQEFVCVSNNIKPGSYLHFANSIENDFLPGNLSILFEYGIPQSTIHKLKDYIPHELPEDSVVKFIKAKKLYRLKTLLPYEKMKVLSNL